MAVNNFAPAEYGGYVLGANSGGGGGGGTSPFEEQYGVAGWYTVEITFQLPEGASGSLEEASVAASINIYDMEDANILMIANEQELSTLLISDNKCTLHIPYLTGNENGKSTFSLNGVYTSNNAYIGDDAGSTCSGGVEFDSDNSWYNVTGDGSITLPLQYMS